MTVRPSILALLLSAGTCAAFAQPPEPPAARRITLREAVDLALARNHAVRLARLSVDEKDRAKDVAKSAYFPQVRNDTTLVHLTDTQLVEIPAGGLGVVGVTPVPPQTLILNQGGVSAATNGTGIVQPLTQLFRVRAANDVARAEAEATRGKARGVEDETALRVHQIYYRILIADVRRRAVLAKIQASEDLQRERIQQVRYGSALEADLIESRAHALQARQELLTTELQRSDLQMQLNDVIGLPLTTPLLLDPNVSAISGPSERCERDACVRAALDSHPEIAEARAQVDKGRVGGPSREVRVRPGRGGVRALQLSEQRAVPGRPLRHGRHSRERRPVRWRPKARRPARARDAARAGQGEPRADFR